MERRTDYDAIAPSYDRRYAWNHYPGVEAAVRTLAVEPARTLEVGCGTGFFVRVAAASGATAFGVDVSREMLARARAHEGSTAATAVVRGRAEALPFAEASFDAVMAINALHHFDDAAAFAREAARVLRPGGRVLVVGSIRTTGEIAGTCTTTSTAHSSATGRDIHPPGRSAPCSSKRDSAARRRGRWSI